jgi:serine/threonine-protein kinase BUR1
MVRTPPKRTASRSPDNGRPYKRFATSSPEEGEVNDDEDTSVPHASRPVSPPRPIQKFETKVKFPFKKKNGVEASASLPPKPEVKEKVTPAVIYERSEEDERRIREKEQQRKQWSSQQDLSRRIPYSNKSGSIDHWEPPRDYASRDKERSRLPGSGWQYDQHVPSRHRPSNTTSDRDLYPSRSRGRSSPSPSHSTPSSTSTRRGKHRLPSHRDPSPVGNYTPPRRDYGVDRIRDKQRERDDAWDRDRDHERRFEGDHGRRDDRHYLARDDRGYHADHDDRYWRPGGSPRPDYGRRDDYDYRDSYEAARKRGMDSYRPTSPGPSARTISTSAYPPRSPSPEHTTDGPRTPPPPSEPPPPPPPLASPKDETLPTSHASVSIPLPIRRPGAPLDLHSPAPLDLPPVNESVVKREQERKGSEGEVREVREIKKRMPVRRSRKEEYEAYGRSFGGCGMQSDYNVTTKLGEGTFGSVNVFHPLKFCLSHFLFTEKCTKPYTLPVSELSH